MKEPRFDVYRLEVFEPVYTASVQIGDEKREVSIPVGGALFMDIVITDRDELRAHVYSAMRYNCGDLWITHFGARRLVTCCAQFDAEYMF